MNSNLSGVRTRDGAFNPSHLLSRHSAFCLLKCAALLLVVFVAGCERYKDISFGELDLSVAGATLETEFENFARYGGTFHLVFLDWDKKMRQHPDRPMWDTPVEWPLRLNTTITDTETKAVIIDETSDDHYSLLIERMNGHPLKPFTVMLHRFNTDGQWTQGELEQELRRGRTYSIKMEVVEPDPDLGRCELIFRGWY